jgi:hypothetical protein
MRGFRLALGWILFAPAAMAGAVVRIASYNIDCADQGSDNNITGATHSISTVIQGIGNHHIGNNAQAVDVLGLEELNSTTGANLTTQLNAIYGAGKYAFDPTADATTGGGTDGLIYNTSTIQVVSARALPNGTNVVRQSNGTYAGAAGNGVGGSVPRAPMVYQLRPAGTPNGSADFYMYVSHARSTSDTATGTARYAEAQEIRADAKYLVPAGAHILYSGDWNLFNGSGEDAYKCLTGQTTSDGQSWSDSTQGDDSTSKTAGGGTTSWSNAASDNANYLYNDRSDNIGSRLDVHLVSASMLNQPGLQIAADPADPLTGNFPSSKYGYASIVFGNDGTLARGSGVSVAANHALDDLANASTVLADLQLNGSGSSFTGSDHLPVVTDFVVNTPEPASACALMLGCLAMSGRRRRRSVR